MANYGVQQGFVLDPYPYVPCTITFGWYYYEFIDYFIHVLL